MVDLGLLYWNRTAEFCTPERTIIAGEACVPEFADSVAAPAVPPLVWEDPEGAGAIELLVSACGRTAAELALLPDAAPDVRLGPDCMPEDTCDALAGDAWGPLFTMPGGLVDL
mmetsp:Transcript_5816/g.13847  ORF Transcript_5816/g.13847 Transcript_5816/m.13847 type:complete len:113 (+) Transcript_5816:64-402(+)